MLMCQALLTPPASQTLNKALCEGPSGTAGGDWGEAADLKGRLLCHVEEVWLCAAACSTGRAIRARQSSDVVLVRACFSALSCIGLVCRHDGGRPFLWFMA